MSILVIDNYDSFTYNVVDYVGKSVTEPIHVIRNDEITCEQISDLAPRAIIISPGPKTPADAGISNDVIRKFGSSIPIFGICLGHQCIGEVFGATVGSAATLMHGKTSAITIENEHLLFDQLPNPFVATRYHSLAILKDTVPDTLLVLATANDDHDIMAVAHRDYPIVGVQFHPESVCTDSGLKMIRNFLVLIAGLTEREI